MKAKVQPVARIHPKSKAGRQLIKVAKELPKINSPEVEAWNKVVEEKRKCRKS